jgi:hypothetical protein
MLHSCQRGCVAREPFLGVTRKKITGNEHVRDGADARRTSALLVTEWFTKLGPLCKVKLLKNQGDKLVVRSPEKAALSGAESKPLGRR